MSALIFTAGLGATLAPLCGIPAFHARPRLALAFVCAGFALALLSGAST